MKLVYQGFLKKKNEEKYIMFCYIQRVRYDTKDTNFYNKRQGKQSSNTSYKLSITLKMMTSVFYSLKKRRKGGMNEISIREIAISGSLF